MIELQFKRKVRRCEMYRKSGKYKNYCRKRKKRKDNILKSVIKTLKGMNREEKKKRTELF
jgi:hypothetical protein